jgi:hypothetical protein
MIIAAILAALIVYGIFWLAAQRKKQKKNQFKKLNGK